MMRKIIEAIVFASKNHATQLRKDGKTPYINHPLEVLHLLVNTGEISDSTILIAAVLHDILEDTSISPFEISNLFGESVLNIVLELTDDKLMSKEVRKQNQLSAATGLSPSAKIIRIADKISNVYDVIYVPPLHWNLERRRNYVKWANDVVDKIRGGNYKLEQHFDALIIQGNSILKN